MLEENINNILKKKEGNEKNINDINEGHLKNCKIKRNIDKNSFNLPQILSASVHNVKQINDISNNFNSEIKFNSLRISQDAFDLDKNENDIKSDNKIKLEKNESITNNKEKFNTYIELNTLDFEKAINYDKRTIFEYYLFLIKYKNIILFSFYPMNDYNSIVIKTCIFSLSTAILYTINFSFFNETIIHKIYKLDGKYDILYFIPKIIISFIISYIITRIIQYIFLSERFIIQIKKQKNLSLAKKLSKKVISDLYLKYILFFMFSYILLLFLWFLLSSFSAVYQNTERIILYNTLISFILSNCYTLAFNIIPAIIRIKSLNLKDKNKKLMFRISKVLQLL